MSWQTSFLAMSAALGEDMAASVPALGEALDADARDFVRKLESNTKTQRANALARALAAIAKDVARMDLVGEGA